MRKQIYIILTFLFVGSLSWLYIQKDLITPTTRSDNQKDELRSQSHSEEVDSKSNIVTERLTASPESPHPDSTTSTAHLQSFYVAVSIANVYKDPNSESETVTQALHGEPVRILTWDESWAKVSLPDQFDYQGWIQVSAIKIIPPGKMWTNHKIVSVKNSEVRTLPNQDSELLTVLPIGTVVTSDVSEVNDRFTAIQMVDGVRGYIWSEDLLDYSSRDPADVSGDRILDTARQFLDLPYLWGGMTTEGVDCSGFVHTVFKVNGIRLHRDADLQYLYDGIRVNIDELKPGDLVFFETYTYGASHVGIYVGDGKFIHSSSKLGVSYASLDTSYFAERFLGSKRILD
ncbi:MULTISPECIES: C40 family peptidase [Limnospira]|uniref:C40 family peptidase n=1 Tax=Limnospira TaxID=2596745 RepID=UPI0002803D67|nr:NLP/P60 protein [Arthrospira platensis C1]MDY7054957.1 C40 family peptidase [Limnospira fusiformis LS22]UWU48715.1 NlpC/P60 family protein [Arthrospira platensis C1]